MSDVSFKAFGVFCFSVICFGLGTLFIGAIIASGDDDGTFQIAWLVGAIVFGIAMILTYG